jgi:hypothetical protein
MSIRTYTQHSMRGPKSVVTWSQRNCQRCKRFLGRRELKYCDRCRLIIQKEQHKDYRHLAEYREDNILRARVYRHVDEINVGDYV